MSLSKEDIKSLGVLARLELSDEEVARAEKELDAILGYVGRLADVDTTGVEPASPIPASTFRADEVLENNPMTRDLILGNFPQRQGDLLCTPGVFLSPKGKKIV